jgi:hypothetical protein
MQISAPKGSPPSNLAEKEAEKVRKALEEEYVEKLKDAAATKVSRDVSDEQKERFNTAYKATVVRRRHFSPPRSVSRVETGKTSAHA